MITSYAPGRVELLGNHTDYNDGFVLSIAINLGVSIEASKTNTRKIKLRSDKFEKPFETNIGKIEPIKSKHWANYVLGVIDELQIRGNKIEGFSFDIDGNLPIGAGLASSAAFEVATAIALAKMFDIKLSTLELAKICQAAEHNFVGVKCGLLDQISSLFSKKGCCTFIDFRTMQIKNIPISKEYGFVIVNSLKKHALVRGEYNERRASCESAAKKLSVKALRDVDFDTLEKNKGILSEIELKRAMHIVGENGRVLKAIELIGKNQFEKIGELMLESHESSRKYFENSCEELDFLVRKAVSIDGCIGSRLSGGGFGGATINLVKNESIRNFSKRIEKEFRKQFGLKPQIISFESSDGAK